MAQPVSQGGIDYPDGGFASGAGSFPLLGDLGELAVRLGSPDSHERQGTVMFMDSFEGGPGIWESVLTGAASEVIISSEAARTGAYSCKLVPDTGAGNRAGIKRFFPAPSTGKYGFEFSVYLEGLFNKILLDIKHRNGTHSYRFQCTYDRADETLAIVDDDAGKVTVLTSFGLYAGDGCFHSLKLVFDLDSHLYERAVVNGVSYDLSAYSGDSDTDTDYPSIQTEIDFYNETGESPYAYIDDIILTANEP